jgi:hypothetical protein
LGEKGTCFIIIKQVQYPQGLRGEGDKKIVYKGERKGDRNQSSEDLRHGNNCCALSVTICLHHRIASSSMGKYSVFYIEVGINPTFFFMYACYYVIFMFKFINCLVNYGVVQLLCVVSLMAGPTTGVPMSSWYGGYKTATPSPYYSKATYARTSYCTEIYK